MSGESTGSILREYKNVEKSIADSVDKLGYVTPDKLKQFTVSTYTEDTNCAWLYSRAKSLMEDSGQCPYTISIPMLDAQGKPRFTVEKGIQVPTMREVPITYYKGLRMMQQLDFYLEMKISLNGRARSQVEGVTTSFGNGQFERQQSAVSRLGGWIKSKF